jgi:hypothetical protein
MTKYLERDEADARATNLIREAQGVQRGWLDSAVPWRGKQWDHRMIVTTRLACGAGIARGQLVYGYESCFFVIDCAPMTSAQPRM